MAKIKRKNLDSVKRAPVRKKSYEAPALAKRHKQVPTEYQTLKKASRGGGGFLWFLFFIFIATVAGFWYWSQRSNDKFSNNSIELSVEGPKEVISGDQVTYKISYENIDIVSMQKMELSVRWPNGFYFDEATVSPLDTSATTWLLEDLKPGQKADLEIKGQLVGQKGEELSTDFTLSYQPENFHSDFKAKGSVDIKISDAKLEVSVEALDKILVSTEHEIDINFSNLTDDNLDNLYIDVLYPDDFVEIIKTPEEGKKTTKEEDTKADKDFVVEGDYLKLNLAGQETKTLVLNGGFTVDSKKNQLLVVEVGNMVDEHFRRLARVEKPIIVINPKFDMDFKINGQSGPQLVNWSDNLKYQLEITNKSEEEISDVVISAMIDSFVLDWNSLETVGKYSEGRIVWTKNENTDLATWPAGESRIFTWQVDVVGEPQPDRMVENIIKITIDGLDDWQQVSSPVALTVGESISFTNGVYWDLAGRRVGSGLLPPQVGEETEYLVVWALPQATGFFDSVSVRTVLPPQVDFVSEIDIQDGQLEFDLEDRSLTWDMPEFDNMILPITASFTIRLTPDEASKGQAMTLLNPTTLEASGVEKVVVRSNAIKTSDVVANSSEPVGIVK